MHAATYVMFVTIIVVDISYELLAYYVSNFTNNLLFKPVAAGARLVSFVCNIGMCVCVHACMHVCVCVRL